MEDQGHAYLHSSIWRVSVGYARVGQVVHGGHVLPSNYSWKGLSQDWSFTGFIWQFLRFLLWKLQPLRY